MCCFYATQIFDDYSDVNQVTTEVKKIVDGNVFQLVFKSASGRLLVADLYIRVELFCSCSHGWLNQLTESEVKNFFVFLKWCEYTDFEGAFVSKMIATDNLFNGRAMLTF